MIEVKHLTKAYKGRIVVDDLSFNVATGESVALWGPNGAGKTTVIRCILGLISHQGHITVAGFDTKRDSTAARSLIGYVPQEPALYGALTINETLALSCRLRNLSLDLVSETADLLNLAEPGRKRVADLSGGMRQRLAIGISLLADPLILLLDEP
ncbi:MAG: ABC transporter ATP-binding protein, partial [Acidimicrobiales bacterium]|nr:ABC transporter ATP-binding protein [Acidimicrobiales bacterium]